jgi:plasmid stabilization system protein ParE
MTIVWTPPAIRRVLEIADYIAKDSELRSQKWQKGVFKAVERLRDFPRSGRITPEKNREDIREIFYGKYRIVYHLDEKHNHVVILTVRHGKQILPLGEIEVE